MPAGAGAGLPRRATRVAVHRPRVVVEGDLLGHHLGGGGGRRTAAARDADLDELADRVLHAELMMMWNVELAAAMRRVGRRSDKNKNTMLSAGRDRERKHLSGRSMSLDFDRSVVKLKVMLN